MTDSLIIKNFLHKIIIVLPKIRFNFSVKVNGIFSMEIFEAENEPTLNLSNGIALVVNYQHYVSQEKPTAAIFKDTSYFIDWKKYHLCVVPNLDLNLDRGYSVIPCPLDLVLPDVSYQVESSEGDQSQNMDPQGQTLLLFLFVDFHSRFPVQQMELWGVQTLLTTHLSAIFMESHSAVQDSIQITVGQVLEQHHQAVKAHQKLQASLSVAVNSIMSIMTGSTSSSFRKICLQTLQQLLPERDDAEQSTEDAHENSSLELLAVLDTTLGLWRLLLGANTTTLLCQGYDVSRDHPAVIKRRFTSVLVVSSLSPLCVLLWRELTGIQPGTSLLTLMGFRLEGIFPAALLPLLLTMILFLGPLMQLSMDCPCDLADGLKVVLAPRSWARCLTDMRWLRNQVIAPLTEELVFRACMLPMLAPCTGLGPAVFTCPLFFGVAHFHHIFEQLRFRQSSVGSIFLSAAFQFSYTAVFGAYTAFLFIRTGHLIGPVLCHSFCNYMGFPAVCAALEHPQRRPLLAGYALGVGLFLLLLQPLTDPKLYGSLPLCVLLERAGDSEAPLCP
ncbi:hypothetical protein CB1_000429013 [Camelus ferus]|nr:hypothetical protein CB1_000429013 [Camelus ferus]